MSRIGRAPISIPNGVTLSQDSGLVTVKGNKGELSLRLPANITINLEEQLCQVVRANDLKQSKSSHGLIRSLLNNMVQGVSVGYVRKLELIGTGYRAKKQGNNLIISVGYSHPVNYPPRPGITLDTESETVIVISGIDKQVVGQTAAEIRKIRKPEPYKGKGIRYQGEVIRRKAGKAAKS